MINQDLLNYIENEITRGTPKNIIQSNLLSNGWNEKDVAEGFSSIVVKNYNPTVTPPSANINVNQQNVTQPVSSPLIKINLPNTSESTISQPTISNPAMSPSMLAQQNFQRMSVSQTEPKKSNLTAIITVFVILLVLVGGGFAYYKYLNTNVSSNQNVVIQTATTTDNINTSNVGVSSTSNYQENNATSSEFPIVSTPKITENTGIKDCGTSMTCFISNVGKCLPSIVEWSSTINFGANITTKENFQLKGLNAKGLCIFDYRIDSQVASLTPEMITQAKAQGTTDAEIQQQLQATNDYSKQFIGVTNHCAFTTDYLTKILTNWSEGNFDSSDLDPGNCTSTVKIVPVSAPTSLASIRYLNYGEKYGEKFDNINLTFYVVDLTSTQLKVTITNNTTSESQTVTFKINDSTTLFGHKFTLTSIEKTNGVDRAGLSMQ